MGRFLRPLTLTLTLAFSAALAGTATAPASDAPAPASVPATATSNSAPSPAHTEEPVKLKPRPPGESETGGPGGPGGRREGGGGDRDRDRDRDRDKMGGGPGGPGQGKDGKDDDNKRRREHFRETAESMDSLLGFRVPRRRELDMRDHFMQLSRLSNEEIREKLNKWPPFKKMTLGEQGRLLVRIQEIKDKKKEIALYRARDLNITLRPDQEDAFENSFWDKRLAMDRALFQELEPRRRELEEKMRAELISEFSKPAPASAPSATPASPAASTTNAPAPAPVPAHPSPPKP